jgi:hypothetical protein
MQATVKKGIDKKDRNLDDIELEKNQAEFTFQPNAGLFRNRR